MDYGIDVDAYAGRIAKAYTAVDRLPHWLAVMGEKILMSVSAFAIHAAMTGDDDFGGMGIRSDATVDRSLQKALEGVMTDYSLAFYELTREIRENEHPALAFESVMTEVLRKRGTDPGKYMRMNRDPANDPSVAREFGKEQAGLN